MFLLAQVGDGELINLLSRMDQDMKVTDDWMSRYEKLGMHVIAKSSDLHRVERFVTDGLLKEEQCEELLALTQVSSYNLSSFFSFFFLY